MTPAPTSSTIPANSCPMVTGYFVPVMGCGLSGINIGPDTYSCKSLRISIDWVDRVLSYVRVVGSEIPVPQMPTKAGLI